MKKRKYTGIQILDSVAYWERKLNINFDTEFIRYKKLCGEKLTKKESRKLDGVYYITYSDWEQKMIANIAPVNNYELNEYIHFLNNCSRRCNNNINSNHAFIFPLIISILGPYLLHYMMDFYNARTLSSFVVFFGIVFITLYLFRPLFFVSEDDLLRISFYTDIMYLAKKQYDKNS